MSACSTSNRDKGKPKYFPPLATNVGAARVQTTLNEGEDHMPQNTSPLAGKPVPQSMLVNIPRLVTAYFALAPDPAIASQRVAFGTSGHRGAAFASAFNEAHILAITQAVCLYRQKAGTDGPLFLGMDTHALSQPAFASALEVLAEIGRASCRERVLVAV